MEHRYRSISKTDCYLTDFNDLPSNIHEILQSVCNFSLGENAVTVTPKLFYNYIMLILPVCHTHFAQSHHENYFQNVENEKNNFADHPNMMCLHNLKCTKCLLLCALSSIKGVFSMSSKPNNLDVVADIQHNSLPNELQFAHPTFKPLTAELGTNTAEQRLIGNDHGWYLKVAKLMIKNDDLTHLLIKYLSYDCLFTSYESKKVILTMIKGRFISVQQILLDINKQCTSGSCTAYINVLKELLSPKLFPQDIIAETFIHVQSSDFLLTFLASKFDAEKNTFCNNHEVIEYLSLLNKIIKVGVKQNVNCDNNSDYLCYVLQTSVLPYADVFFSLPLERKGHVTCSKYLKLLGELFGVVSNLQTSVPRSIVDLSNIVWPQLLNHFHAAFSSGLLSSTNFVSSEKCLNESSSKSSISVVTKLIIEVSFKSCAISLTETKKQVASISNMLHSLWLEIERLVTESKKAEAWLPNVFGDQDDKWIISLFCLLIIWTKFNKAKQAFSADSSYSFVEMEQLMHTICPHKLFFQFVRFIKYDHLILADFLTSPETEFLNYLVLYLHTLIENWDNVCITSLATKNRDKADEIGTLGANKENDNLQSSNCTIVSKEETKAEFPSNSSHAYSAEEKESPYLELMNNESFNENSKKSLVLYSDTDSDDDTCTADLNVQPQQIDQQVKLTGNKVVEKHGLDSIQDTEEKEIVKVIEMFIRLMLYIERLLSKNLFPYNARPLLKLLEKVEKNYESISNA
ncbi:uncharacterized protein LOC106072822 [Biomphalaria glabrata]|uniref:Uncharacterized protein LOC106072822 n=1 Tax=Biomphalaria glabrata TaxID=6526 RepID=A0A9U8EI76_BIOGL|nr:uncharacterized protein LOC106072822 [Biomphalaria glabrata]